MLKRLLNSFKKPDNSIAYHVRGLINLGYGRPELPTYMNTLGVHTLGVLAQSKDEQVSRIANVAIVARLTGREL